MTTNNETYWEEHRSTRQGGNQYHRQGETEERTRCGRSTRGMWQSTQTSQTKDRCWRCNR